MAEKYTSSLKKIFFHPSQFFKSVEKDKGYSEAMFFYVKIIIVSAIIGFILTIIASSVRSALSITTILSSIQSSIISIGFAFIIPFIISGIAHLGVIIFRGKEGYQNTYKAVSYPLAIMAIYGIIASIIMTILGITNPISTTDPTQLILDKNFQFLMTISVVIWLISLIHSLAAQVIGVEKFQKVSKARALISLLLIPVIIIAIMILILIYAVSRFSMIS